MLMKIAAAFGLMATLLALPALADQKLPNEGYWKFYKTNQVFEGVRETWDGELFLSPSFSALRLQYVEVANGRRKAGDCVYEISRDKSGKARITAGVASVASTLKCLPVNALGLFDEPGWLGISHDEGARGQPGYLTNGSAMPVQAVWSPDGPGPRAGADDILGVAAGSDSRMAEEKLLEQGFVEIDDVEYASYPTRLAGDFVSYRSFAREPEKGLSLLGVRPGKDPVAYLPPWRDVVMLNIVGRGDEGRIATVHREYLLKPGAAPSAEEVMRDMNRKYAITREWSKAAVPVAGLVGHGHVDIENIPAGGTDCAPTRVRNTIETLAETPSPLEMINLSLRHFDTFGAGPRVEAYGCGFVRSIRVMSRPGKTEAAWFSVTLEDKTLVRWAVMESARDTLMKRLSVDAAPSPAPSAGTGPVPEL